MIGKYEEMMMIPENGAFGLGSVSAIELIETTLEFGVKKKM